MEQVMEVSKEPAYNSLFLIRLQDKMSTHGNHSDIYLFRS